MNKIGSGSKSQFQYGGTVILTRHPEVHGARPGVPEYRLDLLAVGELLVDFISDRPVSSLSEGRGFSPTVGGQAANVVQNVARLGGRSALAARVGRDGFGDLCRQTLTRAGVSTELLIDGEEPTTLAIVARSAATPDFIIYRGADRHLREGDIPAEWLSSARAVHASSFALSHEPSRSAVLAALAGARKAGALVSLDPTYHPRVWGYGIDPLSVLADAYQHVDVTKPSMDDCHRLFGPGDSPEGYARRFLALGPRLVVITLGPDGALMATAGGRILRFAAREVAVADVTGAGDSFWAGFLMALLDGLPDESAVRAGVEVAQIKVQQVGPLAESIDRTALYRHLGLV